MTTIEFDSIIQSNWFGDRNAWFRHLASSKLIGIDWPPAPWDRHRQLDFIDALIANHCPLMPETLSLIAPTILKAGSHPDQQAWLQLIQDDPLTDRLSLSQEEEILTLFVDDDGFQLGEPGTASVVLASSFSPFCVMQTLLLGIEFCRGLLEHWEQPDDTALTATAVRVDGLRALFLQDSPVADRQIMLAANDTQADIYWLLNGYLGYYAMLEPDPLASDNEPIPFSNERNYLANIRDSVIRDERIQRDQLFEGVLNG